MSNFTLAPREILQTNIISDGSKILYLQLCDYAFNNIFCYPSLETLAESTGKSLATLKRATSELREVGLIKIYRESRLKSNKYILIPIEWVEGLKDKDFKVEYDKQFIETEEEFNALIEKIKKYYEEQGKAFAGVKKKRATRGKGKSVAEKFEEFMENLNNEGYKPTATDYVVYFVKCVEELRNGELYKVSWGADGGITEGLFVERGIPRDYAMRIIRKYVEVYDLYFAKGNYKDIKLRWLRADWVYNKIKSIVDAEIKREQESRIRIIDEEF